MNRLLTPEEVAAMWLFGHQYSESRMGAIDWWKHLQQHQPSSARVVGDFVRQMRASIKVEERHATRNPQTA